MRQELNKLRREIIELYDKMEAFRSKYEEDLYFRHADSPHHDIHCVWCGFYDDPCFSLRAFPSNDEDLDLT